MTSSRDSRNRRKVLLTPGCVIDSVCFILSCSENTKWSDHYVGAKLEVINNARKIIDITVYQVNWNLLYKIPKVGVKALISN